MSTENTKKLRGSAVINADGGFLFTPYAATPEKDKKMQLVFESHFSSLWLAKNKVSVRMVFDKKFIPPYEVWIEEISQIYKCLKLKKDEL